MRAITMRRRRRYVEVVAVMTVEKAPIQAAPTVNDPVASDIQTPKPAQQPQFGVKPHSGQMG